MHAEYRRWRGVGRLDMDMSAKYGAIEVVVHSEFQLKDDMRVQQVPSCRRPATSALSRCHAHAVHL